MAKGIAVLQAALDGKRIRWAPYAEQGRTYGWAHWCPDCLTLENEGGGHSSYGLTIYQLWHDEWEIEESHMTFAEADKAIQEGKIAEIVPFGYQALQYRIQNILGIEAYQSRLCYDNKDYGEWKVDGMLASAVHATNWRVISPEKAPPYVPTRDEAIAELISRPLLPDGSLFSARHIAFSVVLDIVNALAQEYPAMFRKAEEE